MIKFFKSLRMFRSIYGEYIEICRPFEENVGMFMKMFKATATRFNWEVKQRSNIPSLLEEIEILVNNAKKSAEYHHANDLMWDQKLKSSQRTAMRLQDEVTRFELEVIHLKELVQEKNMVIDKMADNVKVAKRDS